MDQEIKSEFLHRVNEATSRIDKKTSMRVLRDIAKSWKSYIDSAYEKQVPLSSFDVTIMMIRLKLARIENEVSPLDSLVDIAGYSLLAYDELKANGY